MVEVLRKLILSGGMVFFSQFSATQMLLSISTCLFHALSIACAFPYEAHRLDWLALMSSTQLLVALIVGMAVKTQALLAADVGDTFDDAGFGLVLTTLSGITVLINIGMVVWVACSARRVVAERTADATADVGSDEDAFGAGGSDGGDGRKPGHATATSSSVLNTRPDARVHPLASSPRLDADAAAPGAAADAPRKRALDEWTAVEEFN